MDLDYHFAELRHDSFEKQRGVLAATTCCVFLAAGLHYHAANSPNCIVDAVFGFLMIVLIVQPTWLGLVGMLTFSLTLFCTSLLLFISGVLYDKIVWSHAIMDNSGFVGYIIDIAYSIVVFAILNGVWERPAKDDGPDYGDDVAPYNDQDDVWAPFSGTGKAVSEYEVNVPAMEQPIPNADTYIV